MALWYRDKHVGHRVDPALERVTTHVLFANWSRQPPTIRLPVLTNAMPELDGFPECFEALAQHLSDRIWEAYLYPLQQELFDELGLDGLQRLLNKAKPVHDEADPRKTLGVQIDIGSKPPPAKATFRRKKD